MDDVTNMICQAKNDAPASVDLKPVPLSALLRLFVEEKDQDAFNDITTRLRPMVLRVAQRITRDRDAGEDIAQDTFLELYQNAGAIRDRGALRDWLCTVARWTALRYLGKKAKGGLELEDAGLVPGEEKGPIDEAIKNESIAIVGEEMKQLPEKYFLTLVFCYYLRLTHEKAASYLGWATGTFHTRKERALCLMRVQAKARGLSAILLAILSLLVGTARAAAAVILKTLRVIAEVRDKVTSFFPIWVRKWVWRIYWWGVHCWNVLNLIAMFFPPPAQCSPPPEPRYALVIKYEPTARSDANGAKQITVDELNDNVAIVSSCERKCAFTDYALCVFTDVTLPIELKGQQVWLRNFYDESGKVIGGELIWHRPTHEMGPAERLSSHSSPPPSSTGELPG